MSKNTNKLVPKLRFPEFRDAGEWEEKKLGNEGELFSSLTGKAGADFDAGKARFVTYMNVFSNTFVDPKALRFVDVKEGENQNAVVSGDVFFTISSETPDEVGMSSVLLEELENCYLNSFCALFRFSENKRPNPVFTGYLLRQPLVRNYFTKKAQGSTRFNLSKDAFRSLPLFVPTRSEQQKIADCLLSIDELISAQSQKVEALKIHKKSLMQQLFPREGETVPRLRFSEFRGAGEWEEKPLKKVFSIFQGFAFSSNDSVPYGVRWLKIADVSIQQMNHGAPSYLPLEHKDWYQKFSVYKGDYVLALTRPILSGELKMAPVDDLFDGALLNQRVGKLVTDQNISFVYYLLQTSKLISDIDKSISGSEPPNLSAQQIEDLKTRIPLEDEQQKIADCLSSIDELISAQSQKLDTLKTHKRGLMQQLFPISAME